MKRTANGAREPRRDEWERSRNGMTEIKASRRDRETQLSTGKDWERLGIDSDRLMPSEAN